jgi:hypothetical protein
MFGPDIEFLAVSSGTNRLGQLGRLWRIIIMSRFVLKFRGMCSFVIPAQGKEAWVLLRDLSSRGNLGDLRPLSSRLQLHNAVVQVPAKYIGPPDQAPYPIPVQSSLYWPLSQAILDILPGGRPLSSDLNIKGYPGSGNPDLTKPDSIDKDSFLWVSPLALACRGSGLPEEGGHVNAALLSGSLDVGMAARVYLKGGSLRVTGRASYEDQYVIWRFRPVGSIFGCRGYRQILASEVTFEAPFDAEYVDLQVRDPDNPDPLVLRLRPQGGKIEIMLVNEESSQVIGNNEPEVIRIGRMRNQDRIFESYYNMSREPYIAKRPVPVAAGFIGKVAGDGGAHNAPPCSPSQMLLPA